MHAEETRPGTPNRELSSPDHVLPWLHPLASDVKKHLPKDSDLVIFSKILKADGLDVTRANLVGMCMLHAASFEFLRSFQVSHVSSLPFQASLPQFLDMAFGSEVQYAMSEMTPEARALVATLSFAGKRSLEKMLQWMAKNQDMLPCLYVLHAVPASRALSVVVCFSFRTCCWLLPP